MLKPACKPTNISQFRGKTFAIDVYCFLHKGAFGCAELLVQGKPTDGYVKYVMKYVNLMLHYDIKPILVFDGRNLPSKVFLAFILYKIIGKIYWGLYFTHTKFIASFLSISKDSNNSY